MNYCTKWDWFVSLYVLEKPENSPGYVEDGFMNMDKPVQKQCLPSHKCTSCNECCDMIMSTCDVFYEFRAVISNDILISADIKRTYDVA